MIRQTTKRQTTKRQTTKRQTMRRTLGINVLQCPVCQATMLLLAVITKREVIHRILTHVKVPRDRC